MSGKERGQKSPPSGLSPEEKLLWVEVMRDAKVLPRGKRPAAKAMPGAPEAAKPARAKAKSANPKFANQSPPAPATVAKKRAPAPPLSAGAVVDVDRRTVERLKRGQMPVEATLDLHGHTRAEAHGELDAFLDAAYAAGRRCVLIVTGKGASKSGGGVLRAEVPKWLNEAPNRARILAFAGARPQHGGGGALYVLLRRRRGA